MTVLEEAARRYAAAAVAASNAGTGRIALEALLELEASTHDLIVTAGFPCPYCDVEDCPGPLGEGVGRELGRAIAETPPL